MTILRIFEAIVPVFAIALVGFFYGKMKKIDLEGTANLILFITTPCLIFTQVAKRNFDAQSFLTLVWGAIFVIFACGLLSYLWLKVGKHGDRRGFYLSTMFMNSGNLALPVALFAYGWEGLSHAIAYDVTNGALIFSLGIYLISRKNLGHVLKLPLLYAVALGIFFSFYHVVIPSWLFTTLEMIGKATIPLMLIMLGYRLNFVRITSLNLPLAGAFIRIGGGFALGWLFTVLFNIQGLSAKIIILMSALPSPVNAFILTERYKTDQNLAASTVALSTLASIITIPLLLWWLG